MGKYDNINTGRQSQATAGEGTTYDAIETSARGISPKTKASPAEAAERRRTMRTQGKAGAKLERINLAFSDDNYEFITIMARATGKTMTKYINAIIDKYRLEHLAELEEAKGFIERI